MPGPQPAPDAKPAEADPLIGRNLNDRYRIVEQIGSGGMGRVYKAVQAPLDRVVALKVLGAGHDRDPNFYKRFFLEASVTARLTHPNTITLYDYGRTDDGIFFIAMEFLAGRTLSQAMQADGPLAQERVIHIAQQICRSLREAHGLGIIHRDLKPANVMLLRQHDDHDFVKVLDFGLVKFFSGENPEAEITNAGTFMGSPHYIAPEQARNQSPDQRCDIYSLGVLLYHMLTGRVPFTAPAPVDVILKHLHDAPMPPRELRPDLDIAQPLQEIVLRCMAKAREERFQSMDELLVQLKAVRAQLAGVAIPSSAPPANADTNPNLVALTAQTPHPGLRTPSQPMPAMRSAPAGAPNLVKPPPPPPEALFDEDSPARSAKGRRRAQARAKAPPRNAPEQLSRRIVFSAIAAAAVVVGVAIAWAGSGDSRPLRAVAPVAVASPAPEPAAPTPAPEPPTTLVTITSTPDGSSVRDGDDRFLGTTPFDLRVPAASVLQLTFAHEGYKTATLRKQVDGEHLSLSVSLKSNRHERSKRPNRRSVGYKDDPY